MKRPLEWQIATVTAITPETAEVKTLLDTGRLKDVDNPRYTNQGFLALHNTHLRE